MRISEQETIMAVPGDPAAMENIPVGKTQNERTELHVVAELPERRRHPGMTVLFIVIALAILILINALLSFLLEPYMGSSEEMWAGFHAMPEIDTVYVGTSQCLQGIDPSVVDGETGGSSYNMATNMQSFADSEEAIRCAYEEYGIRRAVLVIDHEMLGIDRSDNARADQSFWHGKAVTEHLAGAADTGADTVSGSSSRTAPGSFAASVQDGWTFMTSDAFFGKPASLTYLTPWVYNRTSDISLNLQEKLQGKILDPAGHRTAQGYQSTDEILDPSWKRITWDEAEEWDTVAEDLQDLSIKDSNLQALSGIRDYCRNNGIQLVVIILPYPNHFSIYRKADYLAVDRQLEELFCDPLTTGSTDTLSDNNSWSSAEPNALYDSNPGSKKDGSPAADDQQADAVFYDFNLILPEYYDDSSNDLYADVGHMNAKGAEQFSVFFGQFLCRLEDGEDLSFMFRK